MAAASDGLGCLQRLSNASIGEAVPRMDWTSAAVQPVTLCRTPVILMNTITTTSWPAATLWMDPEYLLRKLPTLHEAYVVEPSEAAQPARRAAAGIDASPSQASCSDSQALAPDPSGDVVQTMATAEFYAEEPPTMYFARWMGFAALTPLRADASPQHPLLIADDGDSSRRAGISGTDAVRGGGADGGVERRYFRLGTPGAVSSLHFDEYQ